MRVITAINKADGVSGEAVIVSTEIERCRGGKIIPTIEQKTRCYVLCCWFTRLYLPINIVRMDERTGNIFFLAGEENIIEIYPNGNWRYIE
ncbi:MAG: DUF6888 family protein [Stenomitos frigidus ULC029]